MKLLFVKSEMPLSKLIRWGLKEPVSHFAIEFDNKIVFHSNLLGTSIDWSNNFRSSHDVVCSIECNVSLELEEQVYQSILDKNCGKGYDFKAFAYFMWRAALFRFFGIAFPAKNAWAEDGKFLCTGLSVEIPESIIPKIKTIEDPEMISPFQLYLKLL